MGSGNKGYEGRGIVAEEELDTNPEHIKELVGLLSNEDNKVSEDARSKLTKIGAPALDQVHDRISTTGISRREKYHCLWIMKYPKDPRSIPYTLEALKDKDPNLRSMALEVLGYIDEQRVNKDVVIDRMLHDIHHWVRKRAVGIVSDWELREALPQVIEALHDHDRSVVLPALKTIREWHKEAAHAAPHVIDILEDPIATSGNDDYRYEALELLGYLGDKDAIPVLRSFIGDPDLYTAAVKSLKMLGVDMSNDPKVKKTQEWAERRGDSSWDDDREETHPYFWH